MPMYLWQVGYAALGARGLIAEGGTSRCDAIRRMVESVGGTVHACYFALADHDLYVVGEVPDEVAAAALGIQTTASGAANSRAIPLLTVEQMNEAVSRNVSYRPPGS